jgi:hypothetical protein
LAFPEVRQDKNSVNGAAMKPGPTIGVIGEKSADGLSGALIKLLYLKIEEAMTVTLKLKPEVEAGLLKQAQASGMTLEDYLLSMVEGAVLLKAQELSSAEERAAAFEAWSAGHRPTPLLSDYAVSREAMYEGREH